LASTLHIRAATLSDAAAVATVHIRSWQAAYAHILPDAFLKGLSVAMRTTGWQKVLQAGESSVVVAAADEQIVGFVSFGHCRDAGAPERRAEIWALYALPESWGQGVGRQLLQHALAQIAGDGFQDTSLWVLAANARAVCFYERGGFLAVRGSEKRVPLGGVEVEELQFHRLG
jgi:ribosomal protein S18 acetylase RimI-like enzyme